MRSTARSTLAVLAVLLLAACAGNPSSGTREAGRTDTLTQADVGDTSFPDVYSFVQAKRGSWLRQRGVDSLNGNPSQVQVYQDGVRIGGVDTLRGIHPMEIESVRYFDPIQASSRWGFDHGAGAILVITKRN